MHLVFCLGGLPRSRSSERGGGASGLYVWGALPLLLLLRELAKWGLSARCRLPFPAPPTSLSHQFSPHVPRRENSRETS